MLVKQKHRLILIYLLISITWISSLIKQPSAWNLETIFTPITSEERRIFDEKKSLDTSIFKVLYYNKTTLYQHRFVNNFFSLLDINSYFFQGHPREDLSGKVFRYKIIWLLVFPFILGLWKLRLPLISTLLTLLLLSLLKNPDGWDLLLVIPIGLIINNGFNNLAKLWQNWKK